MTPVERVLSQLEKVSTSANGWQALCPGHDDRSPSLSIALGDDGRVLLKCHAGCPAEAVVDALGLKIRDLMPDDASRTNSNRQRSTRSYLTPKAAALAVAAATDTQVVDIWPYHNENGHQVMGVVRLEPKGGGDKTFRPISRCESGWRIGDPPGQLPLYCLPDLATAELVFVAEGEKCVDQLRQLGLVATTSAHGANSAGKSNWDALAGKDVIILPDHDEAGRKYANHVADILLRLDPPATVRKVELPGLADGEDIVEWVDQQTGTGLSPEQIVAELCNLASQGSRPTRSDSADSADCASSAGATANHAKSDSAHSADSAREDTWPDPRPLSSPVTLPPFPIDTAFPPDLDTLRRWVEAIATTYQVPVDLPAMLCLPVAGLTLSKRIELEPQPGWREILALWVLVLLPSGERKSPVLSLLVSPIYEWVRKKAGELRITIAIHLSRVEVVREKLKRARQDEAKGNKKDCGGSASTETITDKLARELETLEEKTPIPPSLIATEATTEAVAGLLVRNDERLLLAAAEADALDVVMGRYSDGKPPRIRHKAWLWKRIAWKIQEQRTGGLSKVAKARLEELIAEIDLPLADDSQTVAGKLNKRKRNEPRAGTTLVRRWKGQEIRVQVLENGIEHDGVVYRSLSAVAKAITGSHWNGRLFFGLTSRRRGA